MNMISLMKSCFDSVTSVSIVKSWWLHCWVEPEFDFYPFQIWNLFQSAYCSWLLSWICFRKEKGLFLGVLKEVLLRHLFVHGDIMEWWKIFTTKFRSSCNLILTTFAMGTEFIFSVGWFWQKMLVWKGNFCTSTSKNVRVLWF